MMIKLPKILIHEYFTGGGWIGPEMPPDLVSEGLAMLCAVTEDFSKWEKVRVYTTLDKRLTGILLTADNVMITDPEAYEKSITGFAKQCDFSLIIAPESKGILSGLNKQMTDIGALPLGCNPEAIRLTGDKWKCHKILLGAGLPVPETLFSDKYNVIENAYKSGFPLVIKPVDGVGCEGVNIVRDMDMLRTVLEYDPSYTDRMLLQEYMRGDHLSVSILSTGKEFVFLSLNRQYIDEGTPFKYLGGEIMPPPCAGDELHNIIKRVLEVIPGLKGYFGVDLIRSEKGYKVIEINPRLTTSYVGLRKVININLAEAMFDAVFKGVLPEIVEISGVMTFGKEIKIG
jgi:predicted ATP-grasp superfamily ATP-dependent carboligase